MSGINYVGRRDTLGQCFLPAIDALEKEIGANADAGHPEYGGWRTSV